MIIAGSTLGQEGTWRVLFACSTSEWMCLHKYSNDKSRLQISTGLPSAASLWNFQALKSRIDNMYYNQRRKLVRHSFFCGEIMCINLSSDYDDWPDIQYIPEHYSVNNFCFSSEQKHVIEITAFNGTSVSFYVSFITGPNSLRWPLLGALPQELFPACPLDP